MTRRAPHALIGLGALLALTATAPPAASAAPGADADVGFCAADPAPPEYYAFPLVPTKRVPGTANADGTARVHFGSTPFGVSLADDGSYLYQLRLRTGELPELENRAYVAWVTTTDLDEIERLGTVGPDGTVDGSVRWNKFLVVVTLEPAPAAADDNGGDNGDGDTRSPDSWTGPVVMRGMSQSGKMHTMAGHGPFQQENCAAYGYD